MHAANEVIMPVLGMIQDTGKIVQWLVNEGQPVKKGEPLLEVETDKAVVEIEAPTDGFLRDIKFQAGEEVPVGQVIAMILPTPEAESLTAEADASLKEEVRLLTASPVAARMAAKNNIALESIRPNGGRVEKADVLAYLQDHKLVPQGNHLTKTKIARPLASPKARRLAAEAGLDLRQVTGSGPDGAVLADDLQRAIRSQMEDEAAPISSQPNPISTKKGTNGDSISPSTSTDLPLSNTWRVMAEHTRQAWTTAPHFFLTQEVNVQNLIEWHARLKAKSPNIFSITDLLIKIVATALTRHPGLNVSWVDGGIRQFNDIHIGLAVAYEEGLAVPVIRHADRLGLANIAARRKQVVDLVQQGNLRLEDLADGTFTISNLGMYGIDSFQAVLNSPQAAILAVGRIAQRVVAVNGHPEVCPMMTITLTCDHRAVDGVRGAEFLRTLANLIEDPLGIID